jgi:hypothetical protein
VHSTVSIDVAAPPELVFRLARDIERWPRLLPHYLGVRREGNGERDRDGGRLDDRLVLRMVAVRPAFGLHGFGLPVVWRARTWSEPESLRLRFQHLGGVTSGMDVTWRIDATPTGCHVAIDHVFRRRLPIPFLDDLLGDEALPSFVDRFFTRPIARRTLATFKALAEALNQVGTSDQLAGTYPKT